MNDVNPEQAYTIAQALPGPLKNELFDAVSALTQGASGSLKWKSARSNPVGNNTIWDADAYISRLRGSHFHDVQQAGEILATPEAMERFMQMLYLREQQERTTTGQQTVDMGISWDGSGQSKAATARANQYWKLGQQDLHFLRYIRVAMSDDSRGGLIVYLKTSNKVEEYMLVGPLSKVRGKDIVSLMSTIKVKDKKTLLQKLENEYQEYVENIYETAPRNFHLNLLGMVNQVTDTEINWYAYTFPDYVDNAIKYLTHPAVQLKKQPVTISTDKKEPTFFYFNPDRLTEGDYNAWRDWMLVIPKAFRPTFMAWVYSIFVPANRGRQALWLQSNGYDGKSQMINALAEFMNGVGYGSVNSTMVKNNFAYSAAYGKRLLSFPDCQNEQFMRSAFTHTILGGDTAPIEFKGKDIFSARLYCKFIIGSNKTPQVNIHAMHELTRIIYIPLQRPPERIQQLFFATDDKGEIIYDSQGNPKPIGFQGSNELPELKDALLSEMPAFLMACKKHYKELCPNDKEIKLSDEVSQALYLNCISREADYYQQYINDTFEFTNIISDVLPVMEIQKHAGKHFSKDTVRQYFSKYSEKLMSDNTNPNGIAG
jgi:hypothetical protein